MLMPLFTPYTLLLRLRLLIRHYATYFNRPTYAIIIIFITIICHIITPHYAITLSLRQHCWIAIVVITTLVVDIAIVGCHYYYWPLRRWLILAGCYGHYAITLLVIVITIAITPLVVDGPSLPIIDIRWLPLLLVMDSCHYDAVTLRWLLAPAITHYAMKVAAAYGWWHIIIITPHIAGLHGHWYYATHNSHHEAVTYYFWPHTIVIRSLLHNGPFLTRLGSTHHTRYRH